MYVEPHNPEGSFATRTATDPRRLEPLPDFNRRAWVSSRAQATWEPRLERIQRGWADIEWLSVVHKVRECALLWVQTDSLNALVPRLQEHGLSAHQLEIPGAFYGGVGTPHPTLPGMLCIVVGNLNSVEALRSAWIAADDETVGSLLGYPSCCRSFYQTVWCTNGSIDTVSSMVNPSWDDAAATPSVVALPEGTAPLANILWRWQGVRAVPHLPCRFDCPASIELAERMLATGVQSDFSEEVAWIREILSWPVDWSALHGIAEIKTPINKSITRTDMTFKKRVVQWVGTGGYPAEGATALRFPYVMPRKPRLTTSAVFQRASDHHPPSTEQPAWRHIDNGFTSREAMDELHAPLVTRAQQLLAEGRCDILDLGCGNGVLLEKICQQRVDRIAHGVDINAVAIDHACLIHPRDAANFHRANLFDEPTWNQNRYALALLMIGRLLEVPIEQATDFFARLRQRCGKLLLYAYPDRTSQALEDLATRLDIRLERSGESAVAMGVVICSPGGDEND